jgi:MFS family permease
VITPSTPSSQPGTGESTSTRALSWETFLALYAPAVILALGTGIALPAIPVLAKSFDVGFGAASFVVTAFLIGSMVGSLPTGWLIDRFGRRPIMVGGPLLTAAMATMTLLSQDFAQLLFYRFLEGWAAQMWLLGRLAEISQRASPGERGRQVNWMYGMDSVGRLAGPLVGGIIAGWWGPRAPFAAYAVLALLSLIPIVRRPDGPKVAGAGGRASHAAPQAMSVAEIVLPRLSFFALALLSAITRSPIFAGVLFLYAAFAYELDAFGIGVLATVSTAITLPIGFVAGWIMDRYGRKFTMLPGFVGVTAFMLLLAWTAVFHIPYVWFFVIFVVAVAAQGLTGGSSQTVGADIAPPNARGRFLGIWGFTGQVGTTVSPMVFAFVADALGYGSAFIFLAAASGLTVVLLLTLIPETRHRHAAPSGS